MSLSEEREREVVEALLTKIRDIANGAARDAIVGSLEVRDYLEQLNTMGFRIQLTVGIAVVRKAVDPPPQSEADRAEICRRAAALQVKVRTCPHCSTETQQYRLRSTFVPERVAESGSHGVIEGAQVRWSCSLCGYGEVDPL